jgi:hypothetical protein
MLGPAQHCHEAGRLLEESLQALHLGDGLPLGAHPRGRLRAGAEHAGHPSAFVAHRGVAEGESGLLRVAVAVHDEGDILHMRRLAGIGARQDRLDLVPDVGPELIERPAERRRVARPAHCRVAVVVEGRVLGPPHDQHGLLRDKRDADQRLERRRPGLGESGSDG